MSMHNKKTARLLQGVALGLVIIATILFAGCETPVGGIEQKPIEELVGKVYKDTYGTLFSISKEGTDILVSITSTYDNTQGKIIESKTADIGTVYLLKYSSHSNYIPSQYQNYTDTTPHSDCYSLIYVRSSSDASLEWSTFATSIGTEPKLTEEQIKQGLVAVTACFAVDSVDKAQEYLNLDNWTSIYISTGIAQN